MAPSGILKILPGGKAGFPLRREFIPASADVKRALAAPPRRGEGLPSNEDMRYTAHMSVLLTAEVPPLHADDSGAIRVGNSRVLLELVIHAFEDGATPEMIVQRYSTTTLSDIYAVLAHYLRHRDEVEAYLTEREQKAKAVRVRIEARQGDLAELRKRLLSEPP